VPPEERFERSERSERSERFVGMVFLIDNYDSFVHNLARYVRELGGEAVVCRNDKVTLGEIEALAPSHIILSPGPCSPAEAGISTDLVRRFGTKTPILGVCLGHQCIGAAYGAKIVRAGRPVHGRTSAVVHDGSSLFAGLPSPLRLARYHSLVIERTTLPPTLRVMATAVDDGEIMAVEHCEHAVIGVQFHPESAASEYGYALLDRFLHGAQTERAALPTGADGAESVHRLAETPRPWTMPTDESDGQPPVELMR
jgi:anthranilate synthase/aminodeoxychorismate synthase-like glutamine amidotransferase